MAETLCFDFHRQHKIAVRVARIFNTFGPGMHPYGEKFNISIVDPYARTRVPRYDYCGPPGLGEYCYFAVLLAVPRCSLCLIVVRTIPEFCSRTILLSPFFNVDAFVEAREGGLVEKKYVQAVPSLCISM